MCSIWWSLRWLLLVTVDEVSWLWCVRAATSVATLAAVVGVVIAC